MSKKVLVKLLSLALVAGVIFSGNVVGASAASAEAKAYSKFLSGNNNYEYWNADDYKWFALVDINKDGVSELIGSNMKNKKASRWVNLVLYRNGAVYPYYGASTQDILYSHKTQLGIRMVSDGTITYETLADDGYSSVKSLFKYKENGKTKYEFYSGHMSGESGNWKTLTKKQYKKYLKKAWAFNGKSSGVKKVRFYKNTAANRNKLKTGKIK